MPAKSTSGPDWAGLDNVAFMAWSGLELHCRLRRRLGPLAGLAGLADRLT